jgi:multisubunit Na+/H+ antiporter MnhB subunit
MGEQTIGLVTGGVLALSGIVMLAMGTERRRRRRSRRRLTVAGTMLFVSGVLVFAASLAWLPPDAAATAETPLPTQSDDLGPRY